MNEVTRCFLAVRFLRLKNQNANAAIRDTPAAAATEPPAMAAVFDFATGAGVEEAELPGAVFPSAAGLAELDVPEGAAVWVDDAPVVDGFAGIGLNATPV